MSKMLLQRILSGKPEAIAPSFGSSAPGKNPFLQTTQYGEPSNKEVGVNRPLRHPMFVGYLDNKPIYAGSRLFVLY